MPKPILRLVLALSMVLLSVTARASYNQTIIEPYYKDCTGTPQTILPQSSGNASTPSDIDSDGRYNGITVPTTGGTNEDDDSDAIFQTISKALLNTSSGGVIYIPTSGVIHDQFTVTSSVTIRGAAGQQVVLDGSCIGGTATCATMNGTGATLTLENITIRGYENGIVDVDGNVRLVNCTIEQNHYGIIMSGINKLDVLGSQVRENTADGIQGDGADWTIMSSVVSQNGGYGIFMAASGGTNAILVHDSKIFRNASRGISMLSTAGTAALTVSSSEIAANTGRGIYLSSRNTGSLGIADSSITANGDDGVYVENNAGCVTLGTAALKGGIVGTSFMGNAGDGLDIGGTGTSCTIGQQSSQTKISVSRDSFVRNGGYGINAHAGGITACTLGQNQMAYNVTANEAGTAQCTVASASSNEVDP